MWELLGAMETFKHLFKIALGIVRVVVARLFQK